MFVISTNNCYNIDVPIFNEYKYYGPVIIIQNFYCFIWINNSYKFIDEEDIYQNNIYLLKNKYPKNLPDDIEIILDFRNFFDSELYLPKNVKVYYHPYHSFPFTKKLYLPLDIKFVCVNKQKNLDELAKLKVPFGCKIVKF